MDVLSDDTAGTIAAAARGDERAFAILVDAYQADMERVSFLVCQDVELAREATQLAWLIAWRRLRTLREPSKVRPWLITVAANESRRLARRERRRRLIEIPPQVTNATDSDSTDLTGSLHRIDLANALQRLDLVDRTIVAMRYGAELSSAEIGPAVGLSAAGVRTRLARTVERIRRELSR